MFVWWVDERVGFLVVWWVVELWLGGGSVVVSGVGGCCGRYIEVVRVGFEVWLVEQAEARVPEAMLVGLLRDYAYDVERLGWVPRRWGEKQVAAPARAIIATRDRPPRDSGGGLRTRRRATRRQHRWAPPGDRQSVASPAPRAAGLGAG